VAESAKDLSTTSLGLLAAYVLPGVVVLSGVAWHRKDLREYLLQNGEHVTYAIALALIISLLLNVLRIAIFSRWLFKQMSFDPTDFAGMAEDKMAELLAAIDEVFRLHQFCSALFFVFPFLAWKWIAACWNRMSFWQTVLAVVVALFAWRIVAIGVLENYEFYHQIAKGILNKQLTKPTGYKAWIIGIVFEWKFWKPYQ
jgi:hypothetical protein